MASMLKLSQFFLLSLFCILAPTFSAWCVEEPAAKESLKDLWVSKYEGSLNDLAALNIRDAVLDELLTGLTNPWAFEFINPDEVLITETSGKLWRFRLSDQRKMEVLGLPPLTSIYFQTGLLDVEIHPDFKNNQRIYFSFVELDPVTGQFFRLAVSTAILQEDRLMEVQSILKADPFSWSPSNFGGALEFDGDGFLYVSVGNRSEDWNAQRNDRLEGKILRLNDDGSVPEDNPFVGKDGFDHRIYALGVRNPQGLHFDPVSGRMFETEHGPMGGDEVNIIRAGQHYGWPEITYGRGLHHGPCRFRYTL